MENNTVTTGEKTFSTSGRKVQTIKPIPEGTYEFALRAGTTDIRVAKPKDGEEQADKLPYVTCQVEVMGTALTEGGKNRVLFPMFFLDTLPNANGNVSIDGSTGLTAIARALGAELEGITIVERTTTKGENQAYLNPKEVSEWLESHAGETFKGRVKIKQQKDGEPRNEISGYVKK